MTTLIHERQILTQALLDAGAILRKAFLARSFTTAGKEEGDIVTSADLEAEHCILTHFRKAFPEDGFMTEEAGPLEATRPRIWHIDPLDGTLNFARGIDSFCVSIALTEGEEILLSGIYDPTRDHLFLAERGMGATLNGVPIQVSQETRLPHFMMAFNIGRKVEVAERCFKVLASTSSHFMHYRYLGSIALQLAHLAAGKYDAYLLPRVPSTWDALAGILLVREAGGIVTDWKGKTWEFTDECMLASNGTKHGEILGFIAPIL